MGAVNSSPADKRNQPAARPHAQLCVKVNREPQFGTGSLHQNTPLLAPT